MLNFTFLFSQELIKNSSFKEFEKLIKELNLVFKEPLKDFKPIKCEENKDQFYQFALYNKELNVEIRYCIRKQTKEFKVLSNNYSDLIFKTIIMNLTHGNRDDFMLFPEEAVKKEFNADWGASTAVELDCEFGKNYKYCSITALHKNNVGEAYIFYLFDDLKMFDNTLGNMENNWFYTLKFKK